MSGSKKKRSATDEMIALGHLAGEGPLPVARKTKMPIPKEARFAFMLGLALAAIVLLVYMRGHA